MFIKVLRTREKKENKAGNTGTKTCVSDILGDIYQNRKHSFREYKAKTFFGEQGNK